MINLVICLPGNNFSGKFLDSFIRFMGYLINEGFNIKLSRQESCNIYYVRNACLGANNLFGKNQKPFQDNAAMDYDYLLWIDSDIIFTPQDFETLFKMDKDVASGMYYMLNEDNLPMELATVEHWDEEFFKKHGHFQFITRNSIKEKTAPFVADYTGFGFILVKKGVFEAITYPWFEGLYKQIDQAYDFSMEDVAWCHKVKAAGFDVWVNPSVIVGHEKRIVLR